MGAIARSDWLKYQGKWATYSKQFKRLQFPLLQEQNKLRDKIKATVPEFTYLASLTPERQMEVFFEAFGRKEALFNLQTITIATELVDLRVIDFSSLKGEVVDPIEDFTTYTEVDPNAHISVTASAITGSDILRNEDAYVYDDKGASHFGNFEFLVTSHTDFSGTDQYSEVWFAVVGDEVDGAYNINYGLGMSWRRNSGPNYLTLRLSEQDNRSETHDNYTNRSYDTDYYITVSRSGTTAVALVYSDAARTVLIDTLTITCLTTACQYIYGVQAYDSNTSYGWFGEVSDLDLQEAVARVPRHGAIIFQDPALV